MSECVGATWCPDAVSVLIDGPSLIDCVPIRALTLEVAELSRRAVPPGSPQGRTTCRNEIELWVPVFD
jgi:hypothetical protein